MKKCSFITIIILKNFCASNVCKILTNSRVVNREIVYRKKVGDEQNQSILRLYSRLNCGSGRPDANGVGDASSAISTCFTWNTKVCWRWSSAQFLDIAHCTELWERWLLPRDHHERQPSAWKYCLPSLCRLIPLRYPSSIFLDAPDIGCTLRMIGSFFSCTSYYATYNSIMIRDRIICPILNT